MNLHHKFFSFYVFRFFVKSLSAMTVLQNLTMFLSNINHCSPHELPSFFEMKKQTNHNING